MLLRQHPAGGRDTACAWSSRLGELHGAVGMAVAFLMTARPSPEQGAAMAAGEAPPHFGAPGIGVEDSGPGLPFVGWSSVGCDLRMAHFVGLHGLHVLPRLGLLFSRLGQILLLTWQALRGQPLVAPDALTLAAVAAVFVGVGTAALTLWRRATDR